MKNPKKNADIRALLSENQIYLYELSDSLGISESALYRWMRHELSKDQTRAIRAAIANIVKVRGW